MNTWKPHIRRGWNGRTGRFFWSCDPPPDRVSNNHEVRRRHESAWRYCHIMNLRDATK